jgi:hypothetical protein
VEVIGAVVGGQWILHAVEGKPRSGDAVGEPADDRRGSSKSTEVILQGIRSEDNVCQNALSIRHAQFGENGAIGDDPGGHAVGIAQGELPDFRAVRHPAKF